MPCDQRVQVWYDEKGKETYFKLLCNGKCGEGAGEDDCTERTYLDVVGSVTYVIYYCKCHGGKGEANPGCQIEIQERQDNGEKKIRCTEKGCDENKHEKCSPKEVPGTSRSVAIREKDGTFKGRVGRIAQWKCECLAGSIPKNP